MVVISSFLGTVVLAHCATQKSTKGKMC